MSDQANKTRASATCRRQTTPRSKIEPYLGHVIHLTVRAVTVCREYDIAVAGTGETERKLRTPVREPEIYFTALYAYDALHRLMAMNRVPGIALMFAVAQFVAKS
jgi:hypothetical protein